MSPHDPTLAQALERLVPPVTRDDLIGSLLWTCSGAARLATELAAAGHPVSERTMNRLLHELGYSMQANRKTLEGNQHSDREAQFRHINRRVGAFRRIRQPVVSVDTKKKELVEQPDFGEYFGAQEVGLVDKQDGIFGDRQVNDARIVAISVGVERVDVRHM